MVITDQHTCHPSAGVQSKTSIHRGGGGSKGAEASGAFHHLKGEFSANLVI